MPLAADNPTDRADQLIALTERLTSLVERNTDHLEKRRPKAILETQDESAKLSTLYAQELELIRNNKKLLSDIDPTLKENLKTATERFQAKLSQHESVLKRVRNVTESMIKSIATELVAQKETQTGYSKDANLTKSYTTAPATLTLNEII